MYQTDLKESSKSKTCLDFLRPDSPLSQQAQKDDILEVSKIEFDYSLVPADRRDIIKTNETKILARPIPTPTFKQINYSDNHCVSCGAPVNKDGKIVFCDWCQAAHDQGNR